MLAVVGMLIHDEELTAILAGLALPWQRDGSAGWCKYSARTQLQIWLSEQPGKNGPKQMQLANKGLQLFCPTGGVLPPLYLQYCGTCCYRVKMSYREIQHVVIVCFVTFLSSRVCSSVFCYRGTTEVLFPSLSQKETRKALHAVLPSCGKCFHPTFCLVAKLSWIVLKMLYRIYCTKLSYISRSMSPTVNFKLLIMQSCSPTFKRWVGNFPALATFLHFKSLWVTFLQ